MSVVCPHCEREIDVPEIVEVDEGAELPPLVSTDEMARAGERLGRYNLLKAGWRKVH